MENFVRDTENATEPAPLQELLSQYIRLDFPVYIIVFLLIYLVFWLINEKIWKRITNPLESLLEIFTNAQREK